jgi:hypothetical protein
VTITGPTSIHGIASREEALKLGASDFSVSFCENALSFHAQHMWLCAGSGEMESGRSLFPILHAPAPLAWLPPCRSARRRPAR